MSPDTMVRATALPVGAGLARDDGLTTNTCVEGETAIAGKPAPTGDRGA
ncbi:hypothetical protein C4J83_0537 [Pseudomonas sp. LBUM920]|nr:hypothetical protein C4J83_0537 [Pseudomonas sp. LBUM920]